MVSTLKWSRAHRTASPPSAEAYNYSCTGQRAAIHSFCYASQTHFSSDYKGRKSIGPFSPELDDKAAEGDTLEQLEESVNC
ncbi:hypothetical protein KQX54_017834 [Cotesia glomerata]|uniref:Uncharacterized protein n=1 Tax=Cotesia glomerata TaxID=32391 RepID=A0AAV7J956_COTGL|nr:hypothetical protein KQX54_017834 [Cotesia glomerata]